MFPEEKTKVERNCIDSGFVETNPCLRGHKSCKVTKDTNIKCNVQLNSKHIGEQDGLYQVTHIYTYMYVYIYLK